MRMPRQLVLLGMLAAVAALSAGCGSDNDDASAARPASAGLEGLRADANQLLDGGPAAFKARLAGLRGHPVVVNQWASWCGPCRFEFPFFQRLSEKYEGRIAFLGVDSKDSRGDAEAFLKRYPVPFPHFYDKDATIARLFKGGRAWPTTAFYDSNGKLAFVHLGAYATEGKLDADIRRYALGG